MAGTLLRTLFTRRGAPRRAARTSALDGGTHAAHNHIGRARSWQWAPPICALLFAGLLMQAATGCGGRRVRAPQPAPRPTLGAQQTGIASWYGHPYHGRRTASGEVYDMELLTAAHPNYAFHTWVRVRNLDNGRAVDVRINDRGPMVDGRIIDLSRAAARAIHMLGPGTARVRLEVIAAGPPPASASRGSAPGAATPAHRTPAEAASVPGRTAPAATPASAEPRFTVQVGAYGDRANALRAAADLHERYGSVRVVRDGGISLWRVRLGEYTTRESADDAAAELRADGLDAIVARVVD